MGGFLVSCLVWELFGRVVKFYLGSGAIAAVQSHEFLLDILIRSYLGSYTKGSSVTGSTVLRLFPLFLIILMALMITTTATKVSESWHAGVALRWI